jgi:uncharacterized membrane protein
METNLSSGRFRKNVENNSMHMKFYTFHFIALFLLMLVTGVFWGTWFTLTRSLESFSGQEFMHIGKVIIANVAWPMRFLVPACIIFMLLSVLLHPNKYSFSFYLGATSLIFILIALVLTIFLLVPMDNQIKEWTINTIPADWEQLRDNWKLLHAIRTLAALVSFGCFSISLLSTRYYE